MTTVKVKFRPSTVEGRPGTIVYFVTHRRVVRQITTGYKVFPHEWDDKRSRPVATPEGERTAVIQAVAQRIRRDMNRLDKIINGLNSGKRAFATDEIVRLFHETEREASFFEFMAEVILQLERLGKERTAENYTTALNSFKRFRNGNDIMLNEIDSDLMTEYEAYLKSHDVAMNTVSFYNRILRAVYNRAVEKEMTVQRYPFKHVYTGIDKTVKRALPLKIIRRIKELDLSLKSSLDFARDMFLFSFTHAECRSSTWHISRRRICRTASFPIADERRGSNYSSSGKNPCRRLSTNTRQMKTAICCQSSRQTGTNGCSTEMRSVWSTTSSRKYPYQSAYKPNSRCTSAAIHGPVSLKVRTFPCRSSVRVWGMIRKIPRKYILPLWTIQR